MIKATFENLTAWQLGKLLCVAEQAGLSPPEIDVRGGAVDVVLTANGANKIQVIKEIRALTGLGLKESKDMTEALPAVVLARVDRKAADAALKSLAATGATVEFR